jgi:hypothetical protein
LLGVVGWVVAIFQGPLIGSFSNFKLKLMAANHILQILKMKMEYLSSHLFDHTQMTKPYVKNPQVQRCRM